MTANMPVKNELLTPDLGALRAARLSAKCVAAVNSKIPKEVQRDRDKKHDQT